MALLAAAACGGDGPMVSARLVDPRPSDAWNGWPLYLVEVRTGPLAPVGALDGLWRRFDEVDTVPFLRTLSAVAVVGDTAVVGLAGSASTGFRYDVRSGDISRFPLPDWLHTAEYSPPPALAPGGGHVAYLDRASDTIRLVVRSWPGGAIVWRSPPVHPRRFGPGRGGHIAWGNREQLYAGFPVSDSGPGLAVFNGRIRGATAAETEWRIYPDPTPEPVTQVPSAPTMRDSAAGARRLQDADRDLLRLPVTAFPELPAELVRVLSNCGVPQSYGARAPHNVIHGTFAAPQQLDWAVLCSRDGTSVIHVWWGGPARCPSELQASPDRAYFQSVSGDSVGFARMIRTASNPVFSDSLAGAVRVGHDGIEDFFLEKASTIWVCHDGRWIMLPGAD